MSLKRTLTFSSGGHPPTRPANQPRLQAITALRAWKAVLIRSRFPYHGNDDIRLVNSAAAAAAAIAIRITPGLKEKLA